VQALREQFAALGAQATGNANTAELLRSIRGFGEKPPPLRDLINLEQGETRRAGDFHGEIARLERDE
jgi:hypothetical protein